ncbi:MAG: DUF3164 family protein [Daejeonella sp.]
MEKVTITQQKPADKMWKDEAGNSIPYARITEFERKAERLTFQKAKHAQKLHTELSEFKEDLKTEAQELYDLFCKENGGPIGKGKGGATFFNFDRSVKIEVSIQDRIEFDPNTIELAKDKLDEVLNDGLDGAKEFIKPLVMDAFKTTGGSLDTKRVLGLRRYADRVSDVRYAEAMTLIDKAIRKPQSKEYFRIWVKDNTGEFKNIDLNFSSIK